MRPVLLGATLLDQPIWCSWRRQHTMLVAGLKGSGKSTLIRAVITRMVECHDPDQLQLLLIDAASGRELNTFDGLPHLWGGQVIKVSGSSPRALTPVEEALYALERERAERQQLLASDPTAKDWASFCLRHPEQARPSLLVVVDEFQELTPGGASDRELKQRRRDISFKLTDAAKMGRAVDIWQLDATQRPTVLGIPAELKSQLDIRVVFRMASELDSRIALNNESQRAASLPENVIGRAIYQYGHQEEIIQTLWLDPDEALERVAMVRGLYRDWPKKWRWPTSEGTENDPEKSSEGTFDAGPPSSHVAASRTKSKAILDKPVELMNEAEVWTTLSLLKPRDRNPPLKENGQVDYFRYINTVKWKLIRRLIRIRSNGMCERCTQASAAECHHETYEHLGHEQDHLDELQDLCHACHRFVSGQGGGDPLLATA